MLMQLGSVAEIVIALVAIIAACVLWWRSR